MILIIVNNGYKDLIFQLKNIGKKRVLNKGIVKPGDEFTVGVSSSSMLLLLQDKGGWNWRGFIPTNIKGKINCYPTDNKVLYRGWEIPPQSSSVRTSAKKYYILAGCFLAGIAIIIVLRKGLK